MWSWAPGARWLPRGTAEPVLEASLIYPRIVVRDEGLIVQLCAEVARVDVRPNVARVVVRAQRASGEFRETERLGAGQLDGAMDGGASGDIRQCSGDIICCQGLHERWRQTNHLAVGARIGDAANHLEELRCADDRVGDRARLHQLLLDSLRTKVAAVRKPVGTDDRQGDMVPHPGRGL